MDIDLEQRMESDKRNERPCLANLRPLSGGPEIEDNDLTDREPRVPDQLFSQGDKTLPADPFPPLSLPAPLFPLLGNTEGSGAERD